MNRLTIRDEYDYIHDKQGDAFVYGGVDFCGDCYVGEVIDKLAEYEDLEEQGKLVLFPTYAYFIKDNKIHKGWVQEVVYHVCRKPLYDIRYDDNSLESYIGYLGNKVFLTVEEAIEKLKELQNKQSNDLKGK